LLSEEALEAYQDPFFEQLFPAEIHISEFVGETSYYDPPPGQEFDDLFASEIEPQQESFIPSETETLARTTSSDISSSTASETIDTPSSYIDIHSTSLLSRETSNANLSATPVQYNCDTCFCSFKRKCDLK
jgi:hypothetical protein